MDGKITPVRKRPQTGRMESLTVGVDPEIKAATQKVARDNGMTMSLWVEGLLKKALSKELRTVRG